ncbi:MAG TPA: hypothetical protein VF865_03745 [Acidobacteriaceae bacterium]
MSVIEDVRKVVQDLVAPELKSLSVEVKSGKEESKLRDENLARESKLRDESLAARIEGFERESKLRDESLATEAKIRGELTQLKLDSLSTKIDGVTAKMDFQYASIMNALDLNRRVETLERDKQQSASA